MGHQFKSSLIASPANIRLGQNIVKNTKLLRYGFDYDGKKNYSIGPGGVAFVTVRIIGGYDN